jgi:REP-associated tyrosine transposase
VFRNGCGDLGATLVECNGQDDHVQPLAEYPRKVPIPALVNSREGVSARKIWQRYQIRTHHQHLWSPSYLTASSGGTPLPIIKQYVEQQRSPGG